MSSCTRNVFLLLSTPDMKFRMCLPVDSKYKMSNLYTNQTFEIKYVIHRRMLYERAE